MGKKSGLAAPLRWLIPPLLASAAIVATFAAAEAGSIVDTVRAALATNPEIEQVRADRRAVDQELRQARARWLPSIDVRAAAGPERSHNTNTKDRFSGNDSELLFRSEAELRLSQLLFDGFETQGEIERQRARVDSAARRVEEAAEFLALDAVEAHLEVLRRTRIVELNEDNVAEHQRILDKVRRLERQGGGDIADVRQAEARLADARATLATARGRLADARASYRNIVGTRAENLIAGQPPSAELPATADKAAEMASVANPSVLIAAVDVDVAAAELKKARAGYYPTINAELSAGITDHAAGVSMTTDRQSALLVLRYNLFRGGADIAREREAFHRVNEARATLAKARRRAEEDARVSFNALETARARTAALRAKAEAQRRTRDAYKAQFEVGQRSLLDLLDAENELFLARVALTTAEFTERFAVYRLLAVTGDLLTTLDVAPPREHLDIERRPQDEPTPERIREKTQPVVDPQMEPQPLRDAVEGAPPAEDADITPHVGRPPEKPIQPGRNSAALGMPETPEYASFGAFWQSLTGAPAEPRTTEGTGSAAVETRTVAVEPAAGPRDESPAVAVEPAAGKATPADQPASYESFDAFLSSLFGSRD